MSSHDLSSLIIKEFDTLIYQTVRLSCDYFILLKSIGDSVIIYFAGVDNVDDKMSTYYTLDELNTSKKKGDLFWFEFGLLNCLDHAPTRLNEIYYKRNGLVVVNDTLEYNILLKIKSFANAIHRPESWPYVPKKNEVKKYSLIVSTYTNGQWKFSIEEKEHDAKELNKLFTILERDIFDNSDMKFEQGDSIYIPVSYFINSQLEPLR